MANIVLNTVPREERSHVERCVLDTLALHPGSAAWHVSILGLEGRRGFLVSVASGEHVVGAWTFDRPEHVRPTVLAAFRPAPPASASL
jgi:hypothetical protein